MHLKQNVFTGRGGSAVSLTFRDDLLSVPPIAATRWRFGSGAMFFLYAYSTVCAPPCLNTTTPCLPSLLLEAEVQPFYAAITTFQEFTHTRCRDELFNSY